MASRKAPWTHPILLNSLTGGHQFFHAVINGRYGSAAVFRNNRNLECMVHTNSDGITMIEFGTYNLCPIYESHVFATSIPKQQLIAHLDNETMLAGDPRIINHNVIVRSTAYKPDISILESVLSHGEILVFQFKSIHGAPHNLMTWCNLDMNAKFMPLTLASAKLSVANQYRIEFRVPTYAFKSSLARLAAYNK
jgi:hypothetical protein